jgi:hypothetical protein
MRWPRLALAMWAVWSDLEIADEEIKAAQASHPEQAELLDDTFPSLVRPAILSNKLDELYRQHCRELLNRAARGEDLDCATRAEVAATLCEMTLRSRLVPDAEQLYLRLFDELRLRLPGHEETMAQARQQFTWDIKGQNRVYSQVARRLNPKRPRREDYE